MGGVTTTKTCTKCGKAKPLDEYYQSKDGKFGRTSDCKECIRARKRAYYAEHREEKAAYNRAYNAEHREEKAAYQRAYDAEHREERVAYSRAYNAEHREEQVAYSRAYRAEHREEKAAYQRAYYALIGNTYQERSQEITAKHATRKGESWSQAEDQYLVNSTDRVIDDALALKRTHKSVERRVACLRDRGVVLARDQQAIA